MPLTAEQIKGSLIKNLNDTSSWLDTTTDEPVVYFTTPSIGFTLRLAKQLEEHLGVKNITYADGMHSDLQRLADITQHNDHGTVTDKQISIAGEGNLKKLAANGIAFPGAEHYGLKRSGQWTDR